MTTNRLPKACVLLGAGASAGVKNRQSVLFNGSSDFRPPVTDELFSVEARPSFAEVMRYYPGVEALRHRLMPPAGDPDWSIETALAALARSTDQPTSEQFRQVPAYLRDLLDRCSREYVDTPGCYMQLIAALMSDDATKHDVLFLTLNYDNLLEQALTRSRNQPFTTIDEYVDVGPGHATVVKMHGSVNWFKRIGTRQTGSWRETILQSDPFERVGKDDYVVSNRNYRVSEEPLDGYWLYPILSAPLAGQNPDKMVCPDEHEQAAKAFLTDCRKFLVVGTAAMDRDVMGLLASVLDPQGQRIINVINRNQREAIITYDRLESIFDANRRNQPTSGFMRERILATRTYNGNFESYVDNSDMFRAFVNA